MFIIIYASTSGRRVRCNNNAARVLSSMHIIITITNSGVITNLVLCMGDGGGLLFCTYVTIVPTKKKCRSVKYNMFGSCIRKIAHGGI